MDLHRFFVLRFLLFSISDFYSNIIYFLIYKLCNWERWVIQLSCFWAHYNSWSWIGRSRVARSLHFRDFHFDNPRTRTRCDVWNPAVASQLPPTSVSRGQARMAKGQRVKHKNKYAVTGRARWGRGKCRCEFRTRSGSFLWNSKWMDLAVHR